MVLKPAMAFLLAFACFAGDKVSDAFKPPPFDQIKIEGMLGERMRVNLEGRLLNVDEKGLLEGFQHRPGKQEWIGEHIGKFLDAASNSYRYSHDERLKTMLDRMARELIVNQLPDGYLGTYTDDKRWTSWDVWVHKYDLIGLLSYYQLTGDEPALGAARKIGDLLCRTFGNGPGQRNILQSSTHVGMAASSVLEPMVVLYRVTGEARYLDFCKYIVGTWDEPGGPKLITSLLNTGSVYKTANAKAYEMMSDLVGILELYRVTGVATYLAAAEAAWLDISTKRLYLTGTASSKEHFTDDHVLPGEEISNVGEGCATVTWLQLNWQLLRLTGDIKYAGQIERTIYNQLLGAQDAKNGNICYFTPLNGKKNPTPGINCCVSSEPRGISLIPGMMAGSLQGGTAVLLYAPMRWHSGGLVWKSETDFPLTGTVTLTVAGGSGRQKLILRVPEWTDRYRAVAGGHVYTGIPGGFVEIAREWQTGDRVDIDIEMTVRGIPGGPSYPYSLAIERGPQVLALEEAVNPKLPDLQAAGPKDSHPHLQPAESALPATWAGHQAYWMDGVVAGQPRKLFLVPFADARTYRVWLVRPGA